MAEKNNLITPEERELIEEIRTEMGPVLAKFYNTDFNLLRWVRGWNEDLSEIIPRITNHMQMRKALHLNEENFLENPDNPHLYIMEKANNYLPRCEAKDCFDKEGNVIHITVNIEK